MSSDLLTFSKWQATKTPGRADNIPLVFTQLYWIQGQAEGDKSSLKCFFVPCHSQHGLDWGDSYFYLLPFIRNFWSLIWVLRRKQAPLSFLATTLPFGPQRLTLRNRPSNPEELTVLTAWKAQTTPLRNLCLSWT